MNKLMNYTTIEQHVASWTDAPQVTQVPVSEMKTFEVNTADHVGTAMAFLPFDALSTHNYILTHGITSSRSQTMKTKQTKTETLHNAPSRWRP